MYSWGVKLPNQFRPPCFDIEQEKIYINKEIIEELYISCFGITNFPVSLSAKLYKTELLTEFAQKKPLVQFMGEDLSITLQVLPKVEKLVIIPNVVYYYHYGGITSTFMPYMLDDFLRLYCFKKVMAARHPMPQNADYYMAVELKNIIITWLEMCSTLGQYDKEHLLEEAMRVCTIPDIQEAMNQHDFVLKQPEGARKAIQEKMPMRYVRLFIIKFIHSVFVD